MKKNYNYQTKDFASYAQLLQKKEQIEQKIFDTETKMRSDLLKEMVRTGCAYSAREISRMTVIPSSKIASFLMRHCDSLVSGNYQFCNRDSICLWQRKGRELRRFQELTKDGELISDSVIEREEYKLLYTAIPLDKGTYREFVIKAVENEVEYVMADEGLTKKQAQRKIRENNFYMWENYLEALGLEDPFKEDFFTDEEEEEEEEED